MTSQAGVSTVRLGQSWPRPGLVCEKQSTLIHGPRARAFLEPARFGPGRPAGRETREIS